MKSLYHVSPPRFALVRPLASSFAAALSEQPPVPPIDVVLARRQHAAYEDALRQCVGELIEVEAADDCPDSCFIEDTLVVVGTKAILTRPGATSRRRETEGVEKTVRALIARGEPLELRRLEGDALLDGGDVLQLGGTLFVGRSRRTNAAAVEQLTALVDCPVVEVEVAGGLHLKSVLSAIDDETLVVADAEPARAMAAAIEATLSGRLRTILVPDVVAANVLRLGGRLLIQSGFGRSQPVLEQACRERGLTPLLLTMSEFIKADGALTCCSVILP
jgi:dimethylargininase